VTPLSEQVKVKRVLCTVGSGGVGKTTTAAALGLLASSVGRRALVLTIDPARRLASAMGLKTVTAEERVFSVEALRAHGVDARQPLAVRMLDLKAAWDDMVRRLAPSPEQARAILDNRFYRHLSTDLAGAQEYIACEQLYTLSYERDFDLVVLDTPPTTQALDFLDAPGRILSILDNDAVRWAAGGVAVAGRLSMRLLDLAGGVANKTLEKLAGGDTLKELGEFLLLFEGLFDPLRTRTAAVEALLEGKDTSFVLVASPEESPLRQALFFMRRLEQQGHRVGAVVVNRVRHAPGGELDAGLLREELARQGAGEEMVEGLLGGMRCALDHARRTAREDERVMAPLRKASGDVPFIQVPRFKDQVHDLRGLSRVAAHLVPTGP
jgi:anion-transporting  ArsA/GET3 family ATPase